MENSVTEEFNADNWPADRELVSAAAAAASNTSAISATISDTFYPRATSATTYEALTQI